jgi:hypothetical protein
MENQFQQFEVDKRKEDIFKKLRRDLLATPQNTTLSKTLQIIE